MEAQVNISYQAWSSGMKSQYGAENLPQIWFISRTLWLYDKAQSEPSNQTAHITYRKIQKPEADAIRVDTGLTMNLEGYVHQLNADALRHILSTHEGQNETNPRNLPLTITDILRIPEMITYPDLRERSRIKRTGSPAIAYQKRFDGMLYVIEEVRAPNRRKLSIRSVFKMKADGGSSRDGSNATPRVHVQNDTSLTSASDDSIP